MMSTADQIAAFAAVFSLGQLAVAAWALQVIRKQLKRMADANEIAAGASKSAADAASLSAAMAVVQLEQSVAASRDALATLSADIHAKKDDAAFMEAAAMRHPELLEQYLNNTDRLCSYIIRGFIDEDNYREDYRNWLTETVRDYKDRFGADCRHRNILNVHHAWAEGRKARKTA